MIHVIVEASMVFLLEWMDLYFQLPRCKHMVYSVNCSLVPHLSLAVGDST